MTDGQRPTLNDTSQDRPAARFQKGARRLFFASAPPPLHASADQSLLDTNFSGL